MNSNRSHIDRGNILANELDKHVIGQDTYCIVAIVRKELKIEHSGYENIKVLDILDQSSYKIAFYKYELQWG